MKKLFLIVMAICAVMLTGCEKGADSVSESTSVAETAAANEGNASEAVSPRDENGEWVAEGLVPADIPTITKNVNLFVTAQDENSVTVRLYEEFTGDFGQLEFGNIFHVEVFLDGKWYIVPTKDMDFAFPLTLNVVPYDESRDITYDFFMYDHFPEGRYRVVNGDEFFFEFTAGETITFFDSSYGQLKNTIIWF